MGRRSTRRGARLTTPQATARTNTTLAPSHTDVLDRTTDPGTETTDTFELIPDELGGVTVMIDGFPQSYVHTADPGLIPFEYMQQLAAVVDVLPIGKITTTHIGGAGLTLPRYIEYTRPGSPQIVLEPRADVTARIREELPLPRGHRIRVREQLGQDGITALADDSADLLVVDAFAAGRIPAPLATSTFWNQIARVLRTAGLAAFNVPDKPGLAYAARMVATAASAGLSHAVMISTHDVLRGRRFGNVVIVASAVALPEEELRRRILRASFPTGMRGEEETRRLSATAAPIGAHEDAPSPEPPTPSVWRAV
ncbi:spermidine synthase [Dermatophilus congolensis]|uniref:spermidine synthase n=1 Tax=Dermatophilus congolensis TaxID=1863 RepID=UPI001AAE87C2|nr:fused MFS/spermidine synthase [Dermatophilus congolensis]